MTLSFLYHARYGSSRGRNREREEVLLKPRGEHDGGGRGGRQRLLGGSVVRGDRDCMLRSDDGGANDTDVIDHRDRRFLHHNDGRSASKTKTTKKKHLGAGGLEADELLRSPSATRSPTSLQQQHHHHHSRTSDSVYAIQSADQAQGKRATARPRRGRRESFGDTCGSASEPGGSALLLGSKLPHGGGGDGGQVSIGSTTLEFGIDMVSPRKGDNDIQKCE